MLLAPLQIHRCLNVPFTTAIITVTLEEVDLEEVDLFGSGSFQLSCPLSALPQADTL